MAWMAEAASARARAVRVFGAVTSMSGVTDVVPMAGPSSAKGAKPATSPVPAVSPYVPRTASRMAES